MARWFRQAKLLPPWCVSFASLLVAGNLAAFSQPHLALPWVVFGLAHYLSARRTDPAAIVREEVAMPIALRHVMADLVTSGWILEDAGDDFVVVRRAGSGLLLVKTIDGGTRIIGPQGLVTEALATFARQNSPIFRRSLMS